MTHGIHSICTWAFLLSASCTRSIDNKLPITITTPFVLSGSVSIIDPRDDSRYAHSDLDSSGTTLVKISRPRNRLVARFSDLTMLEVCKDGAAASAGDLVFELPVEGAPDASTASVMFSPDALFAWSASGGDHAFFRHCITQRESILSCGRRELRGALTVMPYDPRTDETPTTLTPGLLGYFFRAGFCELAATLASSAGASAARMHSLSLIHGGVQDAGDQIMNGAVENAPVQLPGEITLSPTYMRQPYAQGVRKFLDGDTNPTPIRSDDLLDLLQCTSRADDAAYGPRGDDLDTTGPATRWIRPAASGASVATTINGTAQGECVASDASDIKDLRITAYRGTADVSATVLGNQHKRLNEINNDGDVVSIVTVDILTTAVIDGNLSLQCNGIDQWGNTTSADYSASSIHISVDNSAPTVSFLEPADGAHVSNTARATCRCYDATGDVRCNLRSPTDGVTCADAVLAGDGSGTIFRLCEVDTTVYPEGPATWTCAAESDGFTQPTTATVSPIIDNHNEGSASITSTLESRIRNAKLTAYAVGPEGMGKVVSICNEPTDCKSDSHGLARLKILDSYHGDILVELRSSAWRDLASYTCVPTGATAEIPLDTTLLLLLDGYAPGRAVSGILSGLSTLGACYVLGAIELGVYDYAEAKQLADDLIGGHFADHPIDYRHALPPDLTREEASSLDDATLSALAHYGVAFLGQRAARTIDPNMSPIQSHRTWSSLCSDVQFDLKLNRYGSAGVVTLLDSGQLPLSAETFRYDLAEGADDFIRRVAPVDAPSSATLYNVSGITSRMLGCRGCTYDHISLDDSILFDPTTEDQPLRPFDRENPVAVCTYPSPNRSEVIGETLTRLECTCDDNYRVDRLVVAAPTEWAANASLDEDAAADRVLGLGLRVADIASLNGVSGDIELDMSVACYDHVDNEGVATTSVIIDRASPTVEIQPFGVEVDGTYVVTASPIVVRFRAHDSLGISAAHFNGSDATHVEGNLYEGQLTLEPSRTATVRAEVWDLVRNYDEDTANVLYVTDLPIVEFQSPARGSSLGSTLDLLATVADPNGVPLERITVTEPVQYNIANVSRDGATAAVSLYDASTAPLRSMVAAGREARICIEATNVAGLLGSACVEDLAVDADPPRGNIANIVDDQDFSTTSVEVGVSVTDATGVASVRVNGVPAELDVTDGLWKCQLVGLPEGRNRLEVYAADTLGNSTTIDSVAIDIDTTPPSFAATLRASSDVSGPLVDTSRPARGTVWLLVSATDRHGIAGSAVTIANGNGAVGTPVAIIGCRDPYCVAYPVNTDLLAGGTHILRSVVRDKLQNAAPADIISIIVDHDTPRVTASVPPVTNSRRVDVEWEALDDIGPFTSMTITVSAVGFEDVVVQVQPPVGTGSHSVTLPASDGNYGLVVTATDDAGHTGFSIRRQVTLDMTRPMALQSDSRFTERVELGYEANQVRLDKGEDEPLWQEEVQVLKVYRSHLLDNGNYVPVWNFSVRDGGDAEGRTADRDLVVEYEYAQSLDEGATWNVVVAWRRIDDGNTSSYAIAASEAMFTKAVVTPTTATVHRLRVRARDVAGNTSEMLTDGFRLDVDILPVVLSGCRLGASIDNLSIRNNTARQFYGQREPLAMTARVYWPLQNPDDRGERVDVSFTGGDAITRFESYSRHVPAEPQWPAPLGSTARVSAADLDAHCAEWTTPNNVHWCDPGTLIGWWYERDECTIGLKDRAGVVWKRPPCTGPVDPNCGWPQWANTWRHQTTYESLGPEGKATLARDEPVQIRPDTFYHITVRAVRPNVEIAGDDYDWPPYDLGEIGQTYLVRNARTAEEGRVYTTVAWGIPAMCINSIPENHYLDEMSISVSALRAAAANFNVEGFSVRVELADDCKVQYRHVADITAERTEAIRTP